MNNKHETDFANILYKIRTDLNLTQKELAKKINVSDRTISKWERGITVPDLYSIRSICDSLGISPSSIISDKKTLKDYRLIARRKLSEGISFLIKNIFKVIITIIFCFLLIYFLTNYKSYSFYVAKYDSDNIQIEHGYFIKNKSLNILLLDNISLNKVDYDEEDIKLELYTYLNGDKHILYESSNISDIYIEEPKRYPCILTNEVINSIMSILYLDITTNNETYTCAITLNDKIMKKVNNNYIEDKTYDNEYLEYKGNLKLPKYELYNIKENNYYMVSNSIDTTIINLDKLTDMGFVYDKSTKFYSKAINKGEVIKYYVNQEKVKMIYKTNNIKYTLTYNTKSSKIDIKVYNAKDEMLMKYKYYLNQNSYECIYGDCNLEEEKITRIVDTFKEIL